MSRINCPHKEHYIDGGINRVILATDGDLNVGISSADELEELIAEKKDDKAAAPAMPPMGGGMGGMM